MNPHFVGLDPIYVGQMQEAHELGMDTTDMIGFGFSDLNPIKHIVKAASSAGKGIASAAKGFGGVMGKVMQNPVVNAVGGPVVLPFRLGIAATKGPKAVLAVGKEMVRNPILRHGLKAAALVYPPAIPAALAIETANQALDRLENVKNPAEAAKAMGQIAATMALKEYGGPDAAGAAKALDVLKKAKALRVHLKHRVTSATPSSAARALVCGVRGDEARGVWLKTHITMEGDKLKAIVYSVAGGEPEVFRFEVDVRPIMQKVAAYHKRLHGDAAVAGMFDNFKAMAVKLGRQTVLNKVSKVIPIAARKAQCHASMPGGAISDMALGAFASVSKGIESIDRYKKVSSALGASTNRFKKLVGMKKILARMTPAQRAASLRKPVVRKAIIDGVVAKNALQTFVKSGAHKGIKPLGILAKTAANRFSNVQKALHSADPNKRTEAAKVARIATIVAENRAQIKNTAINMAGGMPGIIVTPQGKIKRGKFSRRTPRPGETADVIFTKLGREKGIFSEMPAAARGVPRRPPAPRGRPGAKVGAVVRSTLRLGSRGADVAFLQRELNQKQFETLKLDGVFGVTVLAAVRRFQICNGLKADGIVGPRFWDALNHRRALIGQAQVCCYGA